MTDAATQFLIKGPTFTYAVDKANGTISSFRVMGGGQEVITSSGSADIQLDQYRLASALNTCKVTLVSQGKDKVVIAASGILRDPENQGKIGGQSGNFMASRAHQSGSRETTGSTCSLAGRSPLIDVAGDLEPFQLRNPRPLCDIFLT